MWHQVSHLTIRLIRAGNTHTHTHVHSVPSTFSPPVSSHVRFRQPQRPLRLTVMPVSPLDFVLLQFGSPGPYQVFLGFLLCCLQLPITLTTHLFTFYTHTPPHRCLVPATRLARLAGPDGRGFTIAKNEWYPLLPSSIAAAAAASSSSALTMSRPGMEEMLLLRPANTSSPLFDPCNVYIDPVHHWKGTQECPAGWEYWTPNEETNLVTEFNLVCDSRPYLAGLVVGSSVAAFLGAAAFGWLADSWGRTKALHLALYLFVASSLSAYFSTYFIQFAVFYTLQVFFVRVSLCLSVEWCH